jgi:hypothetical protein
MVVVLLNQTVMREMKHRAPQRLCCLLLLGSCIGLLCGTGCLWRWRGAAGAGSDAQDEAEDT